MLKQADKYGIIAKATETIHRHLCRIFFNDFLAPSYKSVAHILDAAIRGEPLTSEIVNRLSCAEYSTVIMRCSMIDGVQYEVNHTGLMSYVQALESLQLLDLPDAAAIATKIRACCA